MQSFYEAFSLPLLIAVFLRIAITPLLLGVSRHLCLWQYLPRVCVMPSTWRSRLHTSLKRSWGHLVGLLPVHHIKGPLECGHLPSVSHVLVIACAFVLKVYKLGIPLYLSVVLPCDFQNTSEVAHVKRIQLFVLVCTHCPRLTSIKQSALTLV